MTRKMEVLLAPFVLVAVLVGGGLWWFLRDDAPAAVSLDSAVESVTDDTSSSTSTSTSGANAATDGTWVVDSETGDFDFESATGTFAGFRVQEELSTIGSTTAVGRTGGVTGSVELSGSGVTAAELEVDLTTITTNESRRDDQVQRALETDTYPSATFTLTEPIELGEGADSGEEVAVTAVGELTIHGVTKAVELPFQAQLVDDTVVIVGSLDVTFSDYGVEVPESPIVLSVDDQGVLELQLLLTRA